MKEAERLVSGLISAVDFEDQSAETKARAALLAHIQRGAVPEGWQLVPKEPTPEMLDAAEAVDWGGGGRRHPRQLLQSVARHARRRPCARSIS